MPQCPVNMGLKEYIEAVTGNADQNSSWIVRMFADMQTQINNIVAGQGMTVKIPDGYALNLTKQAHTSGRLGSFVFPISGYLQAMFGRSVTTYLTANVTLVTSAGTYTESINPESFSSFQDLPIMEGDYVQIFMDGDILKPTETVGSFEDIAITLRLATPPITYVGTQS